MSDQGMSTILALSALKKVSIFDTRVGDEGALQLATLGQLTVMLVDRSLVTDVGRSKILAIRPGLSFSESNT